LWRDVSAVINTDCTEISERRIDGKRKLGRAGKAMESWWRSTVAGTSVLAGELSLSHARPSADG